MKILEHSLFSILGHQNLPAPKTVLQVGASAGQEIEDFWHAGINTGLFIEPLDIPFQILVERCKNKQHFFPVQALAVSEDNLKTNFYVASNGGQSSSILEPLKHLQYYPSVHFENGVEMTGHRVDTLAKLSKQSCDALPDHYDLFFLDVQGAELEVMKGSIHQLQQGKYIYAEICDGDGYKGDVRFMDLLIFLRAFGYKPIASEAHNSSGYGNCLWSKPLEFCTRS